MTARKHASHREAYVFKHTNDVVMGITLHAQMAEYERETVERKPRRCVPLTQVGRIMRYYRQNGTPNRHLSSRQQRRIRHKANRTGASR